MPLVRAIALTTLTMIAFAGNSLLCRMALKHTAIDAASFTAIRLASGAGTLWLLGLARGAAPPGRGNWLSALTLFAYAVAFSFAYTTLPASTGALLLFGAVQATMIGVGTWRGERLSARQLAGVVLALSGLVGLLAPGLSAPPVSGAALMLAAGVAWGVYTLRGRAAGDPTRVTAGNFLRAAPLGVALGIAGLPWASVDSAGVGYAIASGALASGVGYVIWYSALPALNSTSAAVVQLSVPVIAALGGFLFLGEPITARLVLASIAILGGIAAVVVRPRRS